MSWYIEFYKTEGGNEPAKEFIDSLPNKHQTKALYVLDLLSTYGSSLKEPHTKSIVGTKLRGLRIQASPNIYRIFYFAYVGQKFILLHGFTKKTEQVPKKEIETALKRMDEHIRRHKND